MKIIYHCYGGAHSSVIAAAIHLNKLPANKRPLAEDILQCSYFDAAATEDRGAIYYLGKDEGGHDIYKMGCGQAGSIVEKFASGILKIYDKPSNDFYMANTLVCVNNLMRVGGFLSRSLKFISLGRPLVVKGTLKAYPSLVEFVLNVKKEIGVK